MFSGPSAVPLSPRPRRETRSVFASRHARFAAAAAPAASASASRGSNGVQSVVAGVIAGCVTRSCTSPLDVLKIIIQVNGSVSRSAAAAVQQSRTMLSSSLVATTMRDLYSLEGVRGFWKGNAAGCCRLGPYAGAKFFLYDTLQARFLDAEPSNAQRAMCGATAGLIATLGTYPMEVVRTRMITQTAHTPQHLQIKGITHGLQQIVRLEGIRGLYRGGWSGIIGAIPFEGVQFGCYEYLKHRSQSTQWPAFRWPEGKHELDGIDYFVCGSVAGAVAQTIAYPFDTVKKRLQTQSITKVGPSTRPTAAVAEATYYHGTVDCFRKVIRDEGPLALYRGTVPNLARIVPYAAVMFSTYEMSKKALRVLCE
jgi:solute carrier family 25 (mitochondrial phosphate transporter), member 23/24/25/41